MNDEHAARPHALQLSPERIADLQPALRRLEVLLSTDRYDAAVGVIEELRWKSPSIPDASSSLADCGIEVRTLNALESLDVMTVRQLAACPTLELMSIQNMRFLTVSRALQKVIAACAPVGCPRRKIGLAFFVKDCEVRGYFSRCELHAVGCLADANLESVRNYATDLEIVGVLQEAVRVASERGRG